MAKAAKKTPAKKGSARSKDKSAKNKGAEVLFVAAMERYGQRLDSKQIKTLRATARQLANAAAILKSFELANGEEPVNAFAVADEEQ